MAVFRWRHFAGEIILGAVRWYCRYGISYREGSVALSAVGQNLALSAARVRRRDRKLTNWTSPVTPGSIRMQWRCRIMRIISKPLIVA